MLMAKIDRLHELLAIFYARRYPIKFNDLLSLVDYSQPTLKRYISTLRELGDHLDTILKPRATFLTRLKKTPFSSQVSGSMYPNFTPCSP